MKNLILIVSLILLQLTLANSQTFTIYDIDATEFPRMKAKFYLLDEDGKQEENFSPSDFRIFENGVPRQVAEITCPTIKPALAISTVLVMDASGSMGGLNIHLAKTGAAAFVSGLRNVRSETAITLFDEKSDILSNFSTNKALLLSIIDNIYYNKYGWTDYNAGLITPNAGALYLLKFKTNKKVIVFLSDGKPTTDTQTMSIVNNAVSQNVKIYCVAIRMSIQPEMQYFSELTGGKWFDNIFTEDQAKNIYAEILEDAQGEGTPCTIEWISGTVCDPQQINLRVEYLPYSKSTIASYQTPPNAIAKLELQPLSIHFAGQKVGVKKDTVITIKAHNHDFNISNIISTNTNFDIVPKVFSLKNGDSINLTVSFTPKDSSYAFCEFSVNSDKCPETIYASGGWPGKVPPKPTLTLTHPNGGEMFVVGSDTVITWKGVTPTDTVSLQYSTNNGSDWIPITSRASGLKYDWKNIPKPASNLCLVKIIQQGASGFSETATVGGSSLADNGQKIVKDFNGNLIVVGNLSGNANISGRNIAINGKHDFFIAKYNDAGNLLWLRNSGFVGEKYVRDVDVDASGNIYLTGIYNGVVFVSKFNANGGGIWTKLSSGSGSVTSGGISADKDGNITIVGSYRGYVSFFVVDLHSSSGSNTFIAKYNTSGKLIWVRTGEGAGDIIANDVADDNSGNSIIVGNFTSNADFGAQSISSTGNEDIFVVKVDGSGNIQWSKSAGGAGSEYGLSISCDSDGNPVIAGGFKGISNFGSNKLTSRDFDAYISKMDKLGNFLWANSGGGVTDDFALGVASDADGSSSMTGYIKGDVIMSNSKFSSRGGRDAFIAKYDAKGELDWVRTAGGVDDCTGYGVAFDSKGQIAVTGSFAGSADFGTQQYNSGGLDDYFLWRIKSQTLQTDMSDSLFAIVMPVPAANNIDMKQVMLGSVKDSVVDNFVRNNGSYPFQVDSIFFRGADSAAFDLVSGYPTYTVEPNRGVAAEFRFKPLRIGAHNAELVIFAQSDTLMHTIRGIGVQPQIKVINPIIDFGIIQVGAFRDTLQVATVKNIGSATLYVTGTQHGKPNDVDFTTLAGGGVFQLKPNEEAKMDLRFIAQNSGLTSGTLEFHYSGVGSPAVIQLYGEGVDMEPMLSASINPLPNIVCSDTSKGSIEISNSGISPLIVSAISLVGTDANDFKVDFSMPLIIPRDSIEIINLTFNPTSSGLKSASVLVKSNSAINPELEIPISANKDSVQIVPIYSKIDVGYLCPNQDKDTVIIIKNLGTIASSANFTHSDNIALSNNTVDLLPDEEIAIPLKIKAGSVEGVVSEIITVIDDICNYEYHITVSGEISYPKIDADDIFIQTYLGKEQDGKIIIKNSGNRSVTINSAPQISSPFRLISPNFPIEIPAGDELIVTIRYSPTALGNDSVSLSFDLVVCDAKLQVMVRANAGNAGATFMLPDISDYAGQIINVPLRINNSVNISESGVTGYDVSIKFNRTILAPLDYIPTKIDGNYAEILINNLKPIPEGILTNIRFMTGLGNSENTPLSINSAKSIGADVSIVSIDGIFTMLGICHEGGTRLLNSEGNAEILHIYPNPGKSEPITISLNIIEKGKNKISIYNSIGVIKNEYEFSGEIGLKTILLDTDILESGVYFIHFSTPTVSEIRKMIIIK